MWILETSSVDRYRFKNVDSCKGERFIGDKVYKIGHFGRLCKECDKHYIYGVGLIFYGIVAKFLITFYL